MNQTNMSEGYTATGQQADITIHRALTGIIVPAFPVYLFSDLAHRWILHPSYRLIEPANEIRGDNLDLVSKAGRDTRSVGLQNPLVK
jgi:hypothetical protein